ncbi:GntR family transcriptional regulator [Paracoccus sp. DMF-8]|uniref:GntR family transcriptional regulator n=1 Tax=Paracoccus sp. DMF-8 TaxID=3019445 RepID=UPI0023E75543|nr:GntR family transcriptional regulator [Paracoccus sp. DMF-8]MDF3606867.1 GntR family transcriptional regulator [Paracoccus sp. DMF-8]
MMTWQAVQSEVLSRIRNGQWPGTLIPTETTLAAEFGCARATINRALTSLAESGLLERRRKVGTRVAQHPPQQSTLPKIFIRDEIEARGALYGYSACRARSDNSCDKVARQLILGCGMPASEAMPSIWLDDQPIAANCVGSIRGRTGLRPCRSGPGFAA